MNLPQKYPLSSAKLPSTLRTYDFTDNSEDGFGG